MAALGTPGDGHWRVTEPEPAGVFPCTLLPPPAPSTCCHGPYCTSAKRWQNIIHPTEGNYIILSCFGSSVPEFWQCRREGSNEPCPGAGAEAGTRLAGAVRGVTAPSRGRCRNCSLAPRGWARPRVPREPARGKNHPPATCILELNLRAGEFSLRVVLRTFFVTLQMLRHLQKCTRNT